MCLRHVLQATAGGDVADSHTKNIRHPARRRTAGWVLLLGESGGAARGAWSRWSGRWCLSAVTLRSDGGARVGDPPCLALCAGRVVEVTAQQSHAVATPLHARPRTPHSPRLYNDSTFTHRYQGKLRERRDNAGKIDFTHRSRRQPHGVGPAPSQRPRPVQVSAQLTRTGAPELGDTRYPPSRPPLLYPGNTPARGLLSLMPQGSPSPPLHRLFCRPRPLWLLQIFLQFHLPFSPIPAK